MLDDTREIRDFRIPLALAHIREHHRAYFRCTFDRVDRALDKIHGIRVKWKFKPGQLARSHDVRNGVAQRFQSITTILSHRRVILSNHDARGIYRTIFSLPIVAIKANDKPGAVVSFNINGSAQFPSNGRYSQLQSK